MNRVAITEQAATIVAQIQEKNPPLIFHQSGGCCDGSSPMLLPAEDFYLDNSDIFLGEIAGIKYYMNQDQYDYWKHTHLTVDITEGRGEFFIRNTFRAQVYYSLKTFERRGNRLF